jgi:septum formation protein
VTIERSLLVLASSSPRRLSLLRQIGIEPDIVAAPTVDETPEKSEAPRNYVMRMAQTKLESAHHGHPIGHFILVADTVVACGRRILDKVENSGEASKHLALLSGRRHRVMTAIGVRGADGRRTFRLVTTMVRFKRLSEAEITHYLNSNEWQGKAGSYAIQGLASAFIPAINGSYSNVVGLPLSETVACLKGLGYRWTVAS